MKIFEVVDQAQLPDRSAIARAIRADLLNPKTLGLNVLKTLPVVANLLSVYLAAEDIIDGDWVGAGLNIAGIFAGNIKQVGMFAYEFARRHYAKTYHPGESAMSFEKDLATDRDLTMQRLAYLSEIIVDVMRELATDTENKAQQAGQKKKEFKSTGGGAAVGYPHIK